MAFAYFDNQAFQDAVNQGKVNAGTKDDDPRATTRPASGHDERWGDYDVVRTEYARYFAEFHPVDPGSAPRELWHD